MLVTSKLEVINHLLSSVREWHRIYFLVCTLQPSKGSGIPTSWSSCSFFTHFSMAAMHTLGPSLCLNLFFTFSSFILLSRAMTSRVECYGMNVSHLFRVIYPNRFSGDRPLCTWYLLRACLNLQSALDISRCFLHRQDTGWSRSHVPIPRWSWELQSTLSFVLVDPLHGGNNPTPSGLVLKMNNCYKGAEG
jgi:hypothetical protein